MKEAAGAPAKKGRAAPIVAPPPRIPAPSPLPAAKVAGTGRRLDLGRRIGGNGTGAGGAGNGPGGGGSGAFTPARKLTKIPDREYRRFAATGLTSGNVAVTIRVNRRRKRLKLPRRTLSGNSGADSLMCQLTLQYIRFSPAHGPSRASAVAQDVTWVPNWAPR